MEHFSKIRIQLVASQKNKCRAFVTMCFADLIFVSGIKVVEGVQGLFVSFPSRLTSSESHQKICWMANKALFAQLEMTILERYRGMMAPEATNGKAA